MSNLSLKMIEKEIPKINEKPKKISIFSKIRLKKTQIINKIKEKYKRSTDAKSFFSMFGEIVMFGILGGLAYLTFVTSNIFLIFLGIGCGLWLIIYKIVPLIISILSSLKFIQINR